MKKLYFGDIISSDKYNEDNKIISERNSGLQQEFFTADDKLSFRSLNRPIREAFEDDEAKYVNLQTVNKFLFGQKENGIMPDILEEFSPNGVKVGNFFNKEKFVRIPTGAAFIKGKNELEEEYKYTFSEDGQYKKDIFIDNDHLAFSIINRPNIELFERQIGEHFCFDLNNQNTNILINYKIYDEDGEQKILYSYEITFNEYIYTEKVVNSSDDSSTQTTFMDIAPAFRKITSEGEELHNVFDIIESINGKLGSHVVEENNFFSLEEIINVSGLDTNKRYCIVVNLDTDGSELEEVEEIPDVLEYKGRRIKYIGETILGTPYTKGSDFRSNGLQWIKEDIRYSYSKIYAIVPEEYIDYYDKFVRIYDIEFVNDGADVIASSYLEKIDRTTLHIKNIENTNCINHLVVERKNSNVNLSEGHMPEENGEDNLTIGLCTLGYGLVTANGLRYQMFHYALDYESDIDGYTHRLINRELILSGGHTLTHDLDDAKLSLFDSLPHDSKYRIRKNCLKVISDRDCEHTVDNAKLILEGGYDLAHELLGRTLYLYIANSEERDPTKSEQNIKTETGKRNIAIGNGALKFTRENGNQYPADNIAIGIDALSDIGYGRENIEIGGKDNAYMPNKLLNIGYNLNNPLAYRVQIGEKNMYVGYGNGSKYYTIKDGNIVLGFDNDAYEGTTILGRNCSSIGVNNFIIGNGIETDESNQLLIGAPTSTIYYDIDGTKKNSNFIIRSSNSKEYALETFADKVRFYSSQVVVNGRIRTEAVNITSSKALKTDISLSKHNAVDEINKIEIVDFYYKSDKNKENPKIGFISEDTDSIFSTPNKDSMDIYNCIGMLMKAVQELSRENEELKKKLKLN